MLPSVNNLYPRFAEQLRAFEAALKTARLPFHLFHGYRTCAHQNSLYAQGRTAPGERVTNARCGQSLHNYGVAADYVLDGMPTKPGLQWSWQTKADFNANRKNDWQELGALAKAHGFEWGGDWRKPDLPHIQNHFGLKLGQMQAIFFETYGLSGVWDAFKT